jgi:hypothetical protein
MTEDIFEHYLELLRHHHPDGWELHLLLDSYNAHRMQSVKKTAARLKIKLHFIPAGMTNAFQPLDLRAFKVLKSHARRLFLQHLNRTPEALGTKSDAAEDFVTVWAAPTLTTIEEAWDVDLIPQ